jgi:hypothetical protein
VWHFWPVQASDDCGRGRRSHDARAGALRAWLIGATRSKGELGIRRSTERDQAQDSHDDRRQRQYPSSDRSDLPEREHGHAAQKGESDDQAHGRSTGSQSAEAREGDEHAGSQAHPYAQPWRPRVRTRKGAHDEEGAPDSQPGKHGAIATRNRASTLRLTPRRRSLCRVPVFDSAVPLSVCDAVLALPRRPYTSREASGRALVRRRLAQQKQSLLPARVRSCSAVMSMYQPAPARHPLPRGHGLAKEADATWEVVESGRQSSSEIASSGQDSAASSQHPASSQTEPAMT